MKTLTIHLPDNVDEREVKMMVAATLFDRAIFSSGQAADFVGITKRAFLETVGNYNVSIFGETAEDLTAPVDA